MKLYGSQFSPYVRHCRVALAQEGMDFDFIEVDNDESAKKSPTKKVPYFEDGELLLSDSSSILKYVREKAGKPFMADITDYELFSIANTLNDSTINLFLLEKDGLTPDKVSYLSRQQARIEDGLQALDARVDPSRGVDTDGAMRCVCFLDWALFRNRFSIDGLDRLNALRAEAANNSAFAATAPEA